MTIRVVADTRIYRDDNLVTNRIIYSADQVECLMNTRVEREYRTMPKMRKLSAEEGVRAEQEDQALRGQQEAESHTRQGDTLDERFPSLSAWISGGGWIEIGSDHYSNSFIRVLDTGGLVWEGEITYASLDDALDAADMVLARLEEDGEI